MRDSHDPTSAETLRNYLNSLPVEVDSGGPELPPGLREHVLKMRESRVYWASLEEVTFPVDKAKGLPLGATLKAFLTKLRL
jgi:hypothetical protein